MEAIGLGDVPDLERYGHLKPQDLPFLRVCVTRGTSCMWLPNSARTSVRGFRHRLITNGPPVRVPLYHLSKMDTECLEAAVKEDVARGQLIKGDSAWGFPAFLSKPSEAHKAVQRGGAWLSTTGS